MAITIPSKNIYEIQNNKVIDNIIKKLEVNATTPQLVTNDDDKWDGVVDTQIQNDDKKFKVYSETTKTTIKYNSFDGSNISTINAPTVASSVTVVDDYIITDIKIPRKYAENKYLHSVYSGIKVERTSSYTDEFGFINTTESKEPYIKLSTNLGSFEDSAKYFNVEEGFIATDNQTDNNKLGGYFDFEKIFSASNDTQIRKEYIDLPVLQNSFYNVKFIANAEINDATSSVSVDTFDTPEIEQAVSLPITLTIGYSPDKSDSTSSTAQNEMKQGYGGKNTDFTIAENAKWELTEDYAILKDVNVAVGRTIYYCASAGYLWRPPMFPDYFNAKILELKYNTENVTIDIGGETIELQFKNTALVYGDTTNNKSIFSIENNELMQTTNYFADGSNMLENNAKNILAEYAEGKETATIRCSISDYYYENDKLALHLINSPAEKKLFDNVDITVMTGEEINNEYGQVSDETGNDIGISRTAYIVMSAPDFKPLDFDVNATVEVIDTNRNFNPPKITKTIVNSTLKAGHTESFTYALSDTHERSHGVLDKSTRTVFDIGDEVIPYIYGANKTDTPMSKYRDGTPKVFQVVGTNIFYDGAVWQELSLQEMPKKS